MNTEKTGILFSAICILSSVCNLPFHIYTFGSGDGILSESTLVEVSVFRLILLLLGLTTICAVVIWRLNKNATWRKNLEADFDYFRVGEKKQKKNIAEDTLIAELLCMVILIIVSFALGITIYLSFHYYNPSINWSDTNLYTKDIGWFDRVVMENGVWETLSAINLLLAGLFFFYSALRYRSLFPLNTSHRSALLLGILLVIAAGEEISWGQHYLGFGTPELVRKYNIQQEFNIHNLGGYWANTILALFFLIYIVGLPLLNSWFQQIRYVIERLAIPLSPLLFIPIGCLGVLFDEHSFFNKIWNEPPWRLSEARETLFSFVMLFVAILFMHKWYNISKFQELIKKKR